MALDNLAFTRIIQLIKQELLGGKISKIQQISQEEFLFYVRNNNQNYYLLINSHPNTSYINLIKKKPENNLISNNFTLLLKKHLENGKIINIEQQNEDRIVLFEITSYDDYYNNTLKKLYVELIGRASNLILTNQENKVLDCLKKIPLQYNNVRPLLPNIIYELPTKPEKSVLPSSINNELVYRHISFDELKKIVLNSNKIYITDNQEKRDFHFFEFLYLNGDVKDYEWNEGIEIFYQDTLSKERHRQYNADLERTIKNELKKNEKKLIKLQQELSNANKSQLYKLYGDLLLTYSQEIPKNISYVLLKDENNYEHKIELDTRFDVFKNANLYYKKYHKSKTAQAKIDEQIKITKDNIDYFNGVKFHLENADVLTANEIKEELIELGIYRQKQIPKKHHKKNKTYRPVSYYYKNIHIEAGQNNLQNEYLTFKIANKNDYFFHVKDGPGSHVIVHSNKLDESIIRFAANLAALNSKQKNSSSVAVDYTMVRNVKKIPGGKPGKVIIKDYKTIFIDPQKL